MATLRVHWVLGTALIAAAGCAQQPVRTQHSAPAAVPTASTNSASGGNSIRLFVSALPRPLLVFAYDQGWRQVVMIGNERYFCRSDAPSGSLIPRTRCVTQSQLEFIRLTVEQQRQQLGKPIPNDRMG
jgi:hypothetical protein